MTVPDGRSRREMWDERHAARDPIEAHEPDETLVALAERLVPGRALDLATGDGRNAVWLASRGWRVTGVDFSGVALDRARAAASRAGVSADWRQADLLEWQPEPRCADLVIVMFLHLPEAERRRVYGAAAEAVAPGGTLLVVGHDRSNLGRDVPGPKDPGVLFTPDEIGSALPGLVVDEARQMTRDLGDGRLATDAVVVARRASD